MRWPDRPDRPAHRAHRVRPQFAWFPTWLDCSACTVWLERYWVVEVYNRLPIMGPRFEGWGVIARCATRAEAEDRVRANA